MIDSAHDPQDSLPRLPANAALFLDVDLMLGPDSSPRLLGLLLALRGRYHGALAIISAHRLAILDRIFSPVLLAGAGRLGAELRPNFNHPIQSTGAALPQALQTLMATRPFHGRVPVLAADDSVDPAALRAVEQMGGQGIRLCASAPSLPELIAHYWLRNGGPVPNEKRRAPRHGIPRSMPVEAFRPTTPI